MRIWVEIRAKSAALGISVGRGAAAPYIHCWRLGWNSGVVAASSRAGPGSVSSAQETESTMRTTPIADRRHPHEFPHCRQQRGGFVGRAPAGALAVCATAAAALAGQASADTHLLITEVSATGAEFIEIYNPLQSAVNLSDYYLTDNIRYSRIAQAPTDLSTSTDFIVRFPAGSIIPAGGVITVALSGVDFAAAYGLDANYEIPPVFKPNGAADMIAAYVGSVGFTREISDAGEWIMLFHWDGATDLVEDVDIVRVGSPGVNDGWSGKFGECWDGPDPDAICTPYKHDAMTMTNLPGSTNTALSYKRRFLEGALENQCFGNGITGNDETSENIATTWEFTTPRTPGVVPTFTNPPGQCFADIVVSGNVNVADLLAVISAWGPCPGTCNVDPCPADIAPVACHDCTVNVADLLTVISSWGPCP